MDWKAIVGTVAPTIASALGGPFAGMAVKAIANEVLGTPEATEKDIEKALAAASPDMLLKLKEADQAFEVRMKELGVDLEKIAADDRDSARTMYTATKDKALPVLAGLTVAGFFGVVAWILSGKVSIESTLLGFVLGQVSSKTEQVYNFYFGSSAGSKQKTEVISRK